ncbi:MAG: hypothetical protein M3547_01975 [Acidobacteriota bacterium]|nr:hypothetical protein [Acidobacteriota bacterium]
MRHTEDESAPEVGHETSDVSIGTIVKFGAGLAIAAAVISVAMWGLFRFFEAQHEKGEQPVPPMVAANLKRTPREPRLEPDPLSPRRRMQAEENAALTTYGWVDRDAGVVRIPIERAMELLVEKGLPPSKAMAPTPGPGNGKRKTENDPRAGTP